MRRFSVNYRNPGHWDITIKDVGRLFRIRGGPGAYRVYDERLPEERKDTKEFNTVSACMAYICDELMYELIVAKGQQYIEIEGWNL